MKDVYYKVANHKFYLRMDADSSLWNSFTAYTPFTAPIFDKIAHIFTLNRAYVTEAIRACTDPKINQADNKNTNA